MTGYLSHAWTTWRYCWSKILLRSNSEISTLKGESAFMLAYRIGKPDGQGASKFWPAPTSAYHPYCRQRNLWWGGWHPFLTPSAFPFREVVVPWHGRIETKGPREELRHLRRLRRCERSLVPSVRRKILEPYPILMQFNKKYSGRWSGVVYTAVAFRTTSLLLELTPLFSVSGTFFCDSEAWFRWFGWKQTHY